MHHSEIRIVPHGSGEYALAVDLRRRVLRLPLGLDFADAELVEEAEQSHFVAIRDGTVVGCLVMVPQNCSVVKMRQVAVEPRHQGKGIGAAMVKAAEVWAAEQHYTRIELHAREGAVPFYERLQYTIVGEPFTEVGIPHRAMVKDAN